MAVTHDLFIEFFDACMSFKGQPLTDSEAVLMFAKELGIAKCDYITYKNGIPSEPSIICEFSEPLSKQYRSYHFQNMFSSAEIRTYLGSDESQSCEDYEFLLNIWDRTIFRALNCYILSTQASYNLMHDQLTGIHNQNYFMRHLGKICAAKASANYVAFYMNIRNCRFLNNVFGNYATDEIIKHFAIDLDGQLDKENGECLSRLGGDFFTFIALKKNEEKYIQLLNSFPIDFTFGTDRIIYTISLRAGVAELDSSYDTPDSIMSAICAAFSLTKNSANKPFVFYDDEVSNQIINKNSIETELRNDLDAGKLLVYYQPYIDVKEDNNIVSGAEALIRWRREDRMITPVEIIPIAERNKFISDIDFYVLEKVCEKLSEWKNAGIKIVPVSCNFSEFDLKISNLAEKIVAVIDKYGLDHSSIMIEFTESAFNNEPELTRYIVKQLKDSGINVGLDNCADVYFSYKTFTNSDFDYIKIDYRSIDLTDNKKLLVLKNAINLAMELGIEVIVEGISDDALIKELGDIGCKTFQSLYFDKPLSERFFENKLKNQ